MNINPKTVLQGASTLMLDMDGTVLDLAFDNYLWKELVPRRFAAANDMPFEEARDLLFEKYSAVQGSLDWYCLDHWCEQLGMDVVQLHHEVSHRIGYLPGALEFLREVHERDVRVLLVTNSHPDTLALKDAMTGLGEYFDEMYSSHSFGHAKESQEFWHALQQETDFDSDTSLFVDDSEAVLKSAREFGLSMLITVTHPDTTEPGRCDSEFSGVQGVLDMLR